MSETHPNEKSAAEDGMAMGWLVALMRGFYSRKALGYMFEALRNGKAKCRPISDATSSYALQDVA